MNATWTQDDCPRSQPLPVHVILKLKRQSYGPVDRFKARVAAREGFQVYGETYLGTHAPVVAFHVVRIFLRIALDQNLKFDR